MGINCHSETNQRCSKKLHTGLQILRKLIWEQQIITDFNYRSACFDLYTPAKSLVREDEKFLPPIKEKELLIPKWRMMEFVHEIQDLVLCRRRKLRTKEVAHRIAGTECTTRAVSPRFEDGESSFVMQLEMATYSIGHRPKSIAQVYFRVSVPENGVKSEMLVIQPTATKLIMIWYFLLYLR